MSEWTEIKFGELLITRVKNGIYKSKEFHGTGCKIVNMGELFSNPRLYNIPMKRVLLTNKEKEKYLLKNGDLIFARRSLTAEGAGKCSIIKEVTEDTTFESSIIKAEPNHNLVSSDFLFYCFNSPYGRYLLGTILRQVAVAGITGSDLMELSIPIPPLPEQKAIAGVLSSLDDKIDLLHRQNKTLEAMAETLFRQWFIEEAEDDWEEKSLSSVANFINGIACQKFPPENEVDKLPVLKIKELRNGFSTDCDYSSTNIDRKYIVQRGDIIFSWSASLMVKIWDGEDCILNQHLFKVISDEYPKWFIYFWCKQHLAEFISISTSHATTMGHIKREDIDNSKVLVPSAARLRDRSNLMNSLLDKVLINFKQIESLLEQRDMLLPKLMSGELRVDLIGKANETK